MPALRQSQTGTRPGKFPIGAPAGAFLDLDGQDFALFLGYAMALKKGLPAAR